MVTMLGLPTPIRVYILNYLGETQEELRNLTLLSKQVNKDCKRPGIEWEIIPLFDLSPLQNILYGGGSTENFLHNLDQYQRDNDTSRKLQRYCHMIVNNIHQFDIGHTCYQHRNNNIRMYGIESLDISSSSSQTTKQSHILAIALSYLLPNLLEINLTNTSFSTYVVRSFSENCPRLEKVTWNGNNIRHEDKIDNNFFMNGISMKNSENSLKEIVMDDSSFNCHPLFRAEVMSDLNNHPNIFLFHRCCKSLERVSIRNARYTDGSVSIPQNALVKFIRNAPPNTLKWFRSDLNHENMNMLEKEQPGIEFLN